jgi:DNA-binding transcriptional MerR regulator
MKTGKVAKSLGVDQKTITNWTDHLLLRRFFSKEALGEAGQTQRDYTEYDLLILNTIRAERAKNSDWAEIAEILESGKFDQQLPPTALLVESSAPIQQYGRIMVLTMERDAALKEAEQLKRASESKDATIDTLQQEIRKLNREIGRLEGKMEMMQEEEDEQ